jgi:predicted  nucleic acid-binding Zn-ribbon protein
MTIKIECPVCNSSNAFVIGANEKLTCEDCGFLFAENSQVPTGECLICGSRFFYYESPFGLSFLGRDTVCYVCEAHYRKMRIGSPEPHFSEESFAQAEQSVEAQRFKERASHWH